MFQEFRSPGNFTRWIPFQNFKEHDLRASKFFRINSSCAFDKFAWVSCLESASLGDQVGAGHSVAHLINKKASVSKFNLRAARGLFKSMESLRRILAGKCLNVSSEMLLSTIVMLRARDLRQLRLLLRSGSHRFSKAEFVEILSFFQILRYHE